MARMRYRRRRSRRGRRYARRIIRKGVARAGYRTRYGRLRPSNTVHSYKRMGLPATLTGNAVYAPLLSVLSFSFDGITAKSDFTGLYDQYRIKRIVHRFWLRIDPSAQTAATASFPKLYWHRDLDDTNAPGSLAEMRERADLKIKVMNPNRPVVVSYRPNTLNTLYSTALASNYEPVWNKWLDMSSTATTYYGVKYAIDDLTNTNYKVDIETTVWFDCKNPR